MNNYIWVDPPVGWKYGFPKLFDKSKGIEIREWILKHGYPQKEIDHLGGSFSVGVWGATQEEIDLYGEADNP